MPLMSVSGTVNEAAVEVALLALGGPRGTGAGETILPATLFREILSGSYTLP